MHQPWETGWKATDGPAPGSERVDIKVVHGSTYSLWKNQQGVETIQKDAQYFCVSPGAFNTIPYDSNVGVGGGHKGQT